MKRAVWKYELLDVITTLDLPVDAKPLHVAVQQGVIRMWVLVNPDAETRTRRFYTVGTGHELPEDVFEPIHVASLLTDTEGTFVFHVFEDLDYRLGSVMGASAKSAGEK